MSERHVSDEDWPYEPQLIGFNGETLGDLDEHLFTFELSTEKFINAFTSAMEGTAGQHFPDAITLTHGARVEHAEALQEISEYLYDSMDRDTAVRAWATIVRDALTNISGAMTYLDEKAFFPVPDREVLLAQGLEYFQGIEKAFEDGEELFKVGGFDDEVDDEQKFDAIAVQDLPELLETEFDDEGIEDFEEIKDEYGQWVLANYCNKLGEYLDDLLQLCPPDKYPELS